MAINPIIGQAIIGGLSALAGGVFGGKAKKQEQKQALELWQKQFKQRLEALEKLKPSQEYFGIERDLPGVHSTALQMIANTLAQRGVGGGLDLTQMLSGLGIGGTRSTGGTDMGSRPSRSLRSKLGSTILSRRNLDQEGVEV